MLASELIIDAFYLSGILDPDEVVSGFYLDIGIRTLNDMISSWSSASDYIVFFNTLEVTLTAGKFSYTVSHLPFADVKSTPVTQFVRGHILLGNYKYPLVESDSTHDNANNYLLVQGIPSSVYLYQHEAETELKFYPCPSSSMTASMLCKSRYPVMLPFESIVSIADRAKLFIKYSLAQLLANLWQFQTSNDFKMSRQDAEDLFLASNIKDFPANGDSIGSGSNLYLPSWGIYAG